jgi:hypothetical protein
LIKKSNGGDIVIGEHRGRGRKRRVGRAKNKKKKKKKKKKKVDSMQISEAMERELT